MLLTLLPKIPTIADISRLYSFLTILKNEVGNFVAIFSHDINTLFLHKRNGSMAISETATRQNMPYKTDTIFTAKIRTMKI